jgi:hypothetical protein
MTPDPARAGRLYALAADGYRRAQECDDRAARLRGWAADAAAHAARVFREAGDAAYDAARLHDPAPDNVVPLRRPRAL